MTTKNVDTIETLRILKAVEHLTPKQGEGSMLVLTVKDGERIALFSEIHDEMELQGWLKFYSAREPRKPGDPIVKEPCWALQTPQGELEALIPLPGYVTIAAGTGNYRIDMEVSPHGRYQWQAKFNAPHEIKLLREKVIRRAQASAKRGAV